MITARGRGYTAAVCGNVTKMSDVTGEIDQLADEAAGELRTAGDAAALEQFRIKYLGTKGKIKDLMTLLGKGPKEQKPAVGQKVNAVKNRVTEAFEARKAELSASGGDAREAIDVTEPGKPPVI